jgi:hypothetical protein
MADLPQPTEEASTNIILVRRFTPGRIRDEFPALNQPGQDSIPGTDSAS